MPNPTDEAQELLDRACSGDQAALGRLFAQNRERLHLMVRLRLDRSLAGRIDPSDVLQDAFLEATERFGEYQNKRSLAFFLWLRLVATQRLLIPHRHAG
jgi:RNA polymerase sigma-70 factor, ECF subfamily